MTIPAMTFSSPPAQLPKPRLTAGLAGAGLGAAVGALGAMVSGMGRWAEKPGIIEFPGVWKERAAQEVSVT